MSDWINAGFELVGAVVCWLNVRQLYRDKKLQGVVWQVQGFFLSWGLWNLFYYPSLGQWASFWGGVMLVVGNGTWVVLAMWYMGVWERWRDGVLEWWWFAWGCDQVGATVGGERWDGGVSTEGAGVPPILGSAPEVLATGTQASAAPCEDATDREGTRGLRLEPGRQVCLFVGGPLDGEKLAMPAYHVYEGHVIEVTAPGRESDYRMETWGVFEFVEGERA